MCLFNQAFRIIHYRSRVVVHFLHPECIVSIRPALVRPVIILNVALKGIIYLNIFSSSALDHISPETIAIVFSNPTLMGIKNVINCTLQYSASSQAMGRFFHSFAAQCREVG